MGHFLTHSHFFFYQHWVTELQYSCSVICSCAYFYIKIHVILYTVGSTTVMAHWSASRPTVSGDSSQSRTPWRDWYSVSPIWPHHGCARQPLLAANAWKDYFSRSPFWPIGLYMAMPRSTCDSSHRSPTSRLDKDCGLQLPTSYVFLLLPTIGHRVFPVAGARIWNDLPADVTSAPFLLIFRKRLKLHLFRQ